MPKIAFPYWCLRQIWAVIGTYWHRIDTIVCTLSAFQGSENPAFVPLYSQIRFRLIPPSFPFFFWTVWASKNDALRVKITAQIPTRLLTDFCFHGKAARCPSSYPKAFRLLPKSGSSKVCFELLKTFRVTPENLAAGLPLRSRATCSNLRCSWSIPCTLYRTLSSYYIAWYVRCRAMPQPSCGCPLSVPAHE